MKMLPKILAVAALAAISAWPAAAQDASERLVITDASGDRGLLAPFVHQQRGPGYFYTTYVFDSLLDQDAAGKIVAGLASAWSCTDDGMSCDITLNPAARWHDGAPVTAEDVAFTFGYMTAHPYSWVSVANIDNAEVLSSDAVRVTLKRPDASFIPSTLVGLPILPQHIYQSVEAPEQFTAPEATIGSGPYKLVSFDKALRRYLFEANADYYRGAPRFGQLVIVEMTPEAAIAAAKAGEVDVIGDLPFDLVDMAREAGLYVTTATSNHPVRLGFNHRGLFSQTSLRRALAHVLDRQELVGIVYQDAAVVADLGYFQKGSPWRADSEDAVYAHDEDQAAALFEAQGWSRGADGKWSNGGTPVVLRLMTDRSLSKLATALADQLEAFGIGVDLQILETAALQERAQSGEYDISLFASSTLGDPGGIARRVLGPVWNSDGYADPDGKMKALLDAQSVAVDADARLQLLHQFQALYAEELPALMLANPIWASASNGKVEPRFLPDGVAIGIPMALPKSIFLP